MQKDYIYLIHLIRQGVTMTGNSLPGLYAIIDIVAQDIVQNVISISRHEAPMVRMFTDLLSGKQGPIGQHPTDFQLVRVGYIEDHQITGITDKKGRDKPFEVILTGKQWLAAQKPPSGSAALRLAPGASAPGSLTAN